LIKFTSTEQRSYAIIFHNFRGGLLRQECIDEP